MKLSRLLIITLSAVAFSACGVSDPVGPPVDIMPVLDRQVSAPADTTLASPASADSVSGKVNPEKGSGSDG